MAGLLGRRSGAILEDEQKGTLMGRMNRLFRRDRAVPLDAAGRPAVVDEKAYLGAAAIVHDYGVAVQSVSAAGRGCIADVSRLPHSKRRIKDALTLLLSVTDEADLRERLKSSYLLLADWQEGVGVTIVSASMCDSDFNNSAPDAVGSAARGLAWDAWEKWRSRVLQEERALKAELQQLGLW
jgi:hypothetical protein